MMCILCKVTTERAVRTNVTTPFLWLSLVDGMLQTNFSDNSSLNL